MYNQFKRDDGKGGFHTDDLHLQFKREAEIVAENTRYLEYDQHSLADMRARLNQLVREYSVLLETSQKQILYYCFHDPLTGLHNREYLEEVLPQLQSPENFPLSIIVGDINDLKLTNDVFGYKDGDRLLVKISAVLRNCARVGDTIIRWGGDEFLLLLPRTDSEQAAIVCEQITEMCSNRVWEPCKISVALGTATQTVVNQDFSKLFCLAEKAMYKNKPCFSLMKTW